LSYNKKKKSGSRAKTQQERIAYDELEKSAPGAGTTAPQETGEASSLHENITTTEYVQTQKERHRVLTPDEMQAAKKPSWGAWASIAATLGLAVIALAFWAGKLQMRVEVNDSSIKKIELSVGDVDKRINDLRVAMAKMETDTASGKNIQSDYQAIRSELAELQRIVKNTETTSGKHTDEIKQLIARIEIMERTLPNQTK